MDEQKIESFSERILTDVNSAMSCLNVYVGHQLGLFRALADSGTVTPGELAKKTGFSERYLREWLECMAVGGYLDYVTSSGKFAMPEEHSAVLVDEDHAAYITPFTQWIPSFASILPALMDAFRTGGGVPFESYGQDTLDAIGLGNRPMFINDYVSKWIPAMPDVHEKLKAGGRVLEIGCGVGWSSISLAAGFPNARIDGLDIDVESIRQAKANAQIEGVSKQVEFHAEPIEKTSLTGPYDLVTAFECLHDMPYPIEALAKMRELAGDAATVLVADEAANDTLEENSNFLGHLFYNFSVLHCLPQALVFPDAAGTGTVIKPSTLKKYANEAGFRSVEVLPIENAFWRFYRLRS
jgi:2-polyprenyl-3-methyl-5-hydroxy-6-metoxy-1,4-benzoquinol methylase